MTAMGKRWPRRGSLWVEPPRSGVGWKGPESAHPLPAATGFDLMHPHRPKVGATVLSWSPDIGRSQPQRSPAALGIFFLVRLGRDRRSCPLVASRPREPNHGARTNFPFGRIKRVSQLPRPARGETEAAEFVAACARGFHRRGNGDARQAQ